MKLAFITDEVTQSFDEAVRFAEDYSLSALEFRTIQNHAIDEIDDETLLTWQKKLRDKNLCVCSLASSFFKCEPTAYNIACEMQKLKRLCDIADIFSCEFIRGFAFFSDGKNILPPEILAAYFKDATVLLQKRGKTLLLEADPSVNTPNHKTLAACIKAIGHQSVQAVFDPGNDMYDPLCETPYPDGYEEIFPYIKHIHIKDAIRVQGEAFCVKIGTGEVGYFPLLQRLIKDKYKGYLSLETHYRLNTELTENQLRTPGGAAFSTDGLNATAECIVALRKLLAEAENK
ncbi:MAG: TIM barrel protein [Oscillospiraceae bacterium]